MAHVAPPNSPAVTATLAPAAGAGFAGSRILHAIEELTRREPTARKRLVGPDVNFGRELLVALARRTGGWIGWEATNLRGIAEQLAFVALAERGLRAASDVETVALTNRALDDAVEAREVGAGFGRLAPGLGFRRALHDTLLELRTAGVSADAVRQTARPGSPAHDLPAVLARYERLLTQHGLADPAGIFEAALDAFDDEAEYVLDGTIAIAPPAVDRGVRGELLKRLLERGAIILDADAPAGVTAPPATLRTSSASTDTRASLLGWSSAAELPDMADVDPSLVTFDLFAAATPSDELREVCRRVLAERLRWDEVEIVATDVDAYGIALDALCQHTGIGATMLRGLPFARTRLGRALERWFVWLENGLPADTLRQALEAGELRAPTSDVAPTALARELRAMKIGWGRSRYEAAEARLVSGQRRAEIRRREEETEEAYAARVASRSGSLDALGALLRALLAISPAVPERGSDAAVRTTSAALADATLGWLQLVPLHGDPEYHAYERLRLRLELLAIADERDSSFAAALAALRDALSDMRAWPLVTSERKPWSAAGGMVHLTDIRHAGTTARPRIFVVGLDAERTAGTGRQDPLLPDAARRAIAPGRLATSSERREEHGYVLAAALASLRGRVTLSYSTLGALDGREAGPSPILLQALRLSLQDPSASYEQLRNTLRPPASPVPSQVADGAPAVSALLDARDVWLDALTDGPLLLDGSAVVRDAFPMLGAGLTAHEIAQGDAITAHHGLVPNAGPELDPAASPTREISPSALEKLAACPLAWFYRYGLSLHAADDPEYDVERWLDAKQRGGLLHELFELFAREFAGRQDELATDRARERVLGIASEVLLRWRDMVPPPGESVYEVEAAEIQRAALAFLQMERERWSSGDHAHWAHFELGFGSGETPGRFMLPDGSSLAVRGRADRIDKLADGTLRVVDYKTGKAERFGKNRQTGPFSGGRHLQPALYVAAVETLTGRTVSQFEYRFPTERGGNEIVAYDRDELAPAGDVIGSLLEHVRAGEFIPTNSTSDCAWCDYGAICRASQGTFGGAGSTPRALWAEERATSLPQYASMLARRERPVAGDDA